MVWVQKLLAADYYIDLWIYSVWLRLYFRRQLFWMLWRVNCDVTRIKGIKVKGEFYQGYKGSMPKRKCPKLWKKSIIFMKKWKNVKNSDPPLRLKVVYIWNVDFFDFGFDPPPPLWTFSTIWDIFFLACSPYRQSFSWPLLFKTKFFFERPKTLLS